MGQQRVLVVDDHPGFRRLVRLLLESGGYSVVGEAATCEEAVTLAATEVPDLVVLDVLLPDGSGLDVADRLAGLATPPAVVLVSSRSRLELGARVDSAPVRGFVRKDELTLERLDALSA